MAIGCVGSLFLWIAFASCLKGATGDSRSSLMTLLPLLVLASLFAFNVWSKRRAKRMTDAIFAIYLQGLIDRFGEDVAALLVAGDPWQGATQEMVSIMYGAPNAVSSRVHKHVTADVWKYVAIAKNRYALRIEFENGVCVGWQTA